MSTIQRLEGCRTEPLGSYLKSLGLLRLIGEQADPSATGRWEAGVFVLASRLDEAGLVAFLLDEYQPTPLMAPWNGGSGFSPKDKEALVAVGLLESSTEPRLASYRSGLKVAKEIADQALREGWSKEQTLEVCRGRLPDASVGWIDAAVVLTPTKPRFPPLLGSGGNDGRLDFSANFMHRIADVLCLRVGRNAPSRIISQGWLAGALGGTPVAGVRAAVGQFDPGSAGGVNSSPLGAAPSLVNPWDFVLMLEGALMFAGGAARRLGSDTDGKASMPFMVDSSPVGYPTGTPGEKARGELWAPLWRQPATVAEVGQLFSEGRSQWQGRQAKSGLDMVRAVASLGTDRGVQDFVRHAFLERRGLSTAAVAVGRITAGEHEEVALLGQMDPWLRRARTAKEPPAGVATAIRRLDQAIFDLAVSGGSQALQQVLTLLAGAEAVIGTAGSFRDRTRLAPIQGLKAASWLPRLDDETSEFKVAAALASLRDKSGFCLRFLIRPVQQAAKGRGLSWTDGSPEVTGLGLRPLCNVLADAHARRSVDLAASRLGDQSESEVPGTQTAFRYRMPVPLDVAAAFADGLLDDDRIEFLLAGLMLLDWSERPAYGNWFVRGQGLVSPPSPAWAILAPFFHGSPLPGRNGVLCAQSTWPAQLSAGRVAPVIASALVRLRMARLEPLVTDVGAIARSCPPGPRLGAALLISLTNWDCGNLLSRVVSPSKGQSQEVSQ